MGALETSIIITILGMGLVFLGILLLWAVMILMVKILSDDSESAQVASATNQAQKQKAAVAAVVIALASRPSHQIQEFPLPPTAMVSAWQAVMRSNILRKRGRLR
jgi:Na+-transporting methylmalonyl-CoA/oxaloacetate decarboxylase gamma subunit